MVLPCQLNYNYFQYTTHACIAIYIPQLFIVSFGYLNSYQSLFPQPIFVLNKAIYNIVFLCHDHVAITEIP